MKSQLYYIYVPNKDIVLHVVCFFIILNVTICMFYITLRNGHYTLYFFTFFKSIDYILSYNIFTKLCLQFNFFKVNFHKMQVILIFL
jgi:hypothetical protein